MSDLDARCFVLLERFVEERARVGKAGEDPFVAYCGDLEDFTWDAMTLQSAGLLGTIDLDLADGRYDCPHSDEHATLDLEDAGYVYVTIIARGDAVLAEKRRDEG